MQNRIAVSMAVCRRGSRRSAHANHWEMDGDYRPTTNGGKWPSTMVASARIRTTRANRHTRHSWPEAIRDSMPCSAAAVPMMASTFDWKPTDSTGRQRRLIEPLDGSTTLVKAAKLSTVKTAARSRELFPCGASESNDPRPIPPPFPLVLFPSELSSPYQLQKCSAGTRVVCGYLRQFALAQRMKSIVPITAPAPAAPSPPPWSIHPASPEGFPRAPAATADATTAQRCSTQLRGPR